MARKVLILASHDRVLRQLAHVFAPLGIEIEAQRSIRDGIAALAAAPADALIIESGMAAAALDELRRLDSRLPTVIYAAEGADPHVSDNRQSRQGQSPLPTPLRTAEEVRDAVTRAFAGADASEVGAFTPGPSARFTPGPGRAPAGNLRERPVHLLLGQLWRRGATGLLELRTPSSSGSIRFRGGKVAAASLGALEGGAAVAAACGLPEGSWMFHGGDETGGGLALHPFPLALAGVGTAYPPATIRAWLQRHAGESIVPDPALAGTMAEVGLPVPTLPPTGAEAVRSLPDAELARLFTLLGFGLARFVAAAPSRSGGLPEEERRAIEREFRRIEAANHYEVLGVTGDAPVDAIKQAYFTLAKRWHTDAFAGRDLGESAILVERIFSRVSESWKVLGTPEKRAEFDVFLERKAKGLPTDVESVLEAEEAFHKALALYRAQRYTEAEARLRQAVRLNPAEAEFWAYLGACSYRASGPAAVQEARECFARARALIPTSLVTEYLEAQLEIGEGELEAAERRLRKILLEKPDHKEAQRDLRMLRERKEKEVATGRGFLGKLLKRK